MRDDHGEVERDEHNRPVYQSISEKTIEMERKVLELLDTSLDLQDTTADFIPEAMPGFRRFLDTKVKGRKPHGEAKVPDDAPRGVKPATIERYLVVCRRYHRFHVEMNKGRARPAAKSDSFVGPPLNTHRRGRIISPDEFNSWVELLSGQDVRVSFATWLLLAGVPVDEVTAMRFGSDLVRAPSGLELSAVGERRLLLPGRRVLDGAFVDGRRVFLSGAISNTDPEGTLSTSGLRRLWGAARKAHLLEHGTGGPTMRDIKTVGDRVELKFAAGRWNFIARTHEDKLEYK